MKPLRARLLLTHEEEWFQYVQQIAKRKNWIINEVKWTNEDGVYLELKQTDLKEEIVKRISKADVVQAQGGAHYESERRPI